jgi:hypothetical protein
MRGFGQKRGRNSRLRPAPGCAAAHRSLIAVIGSAPIDHSKTSSSKLLFDKFPGVAFLLVLLVLVLVLLVLVLLGLLQRTGFFFSLAISMPASSSSSMISSSSSSWGFAFLHLLLFPFPLGTTAVIGMLLWWPLKRPFVF